MVDLETSGVETTEPVSEEAAVPQEQTETTALDEFMAEIADKEQEADAQTDSEEAGEADTQQEQTNESPREKGIKGRIHAAEAKADKAGYDRGRAEALKEWEAKKAEYEERLAKYAEMELEADAKELAAKEHCSVDFAKRILRMERGLPASETPKTPKPSPVAPKRQTDIQARAQALYTQAQEVQKQYGIDVLELFQKDDAVKAKISSGEWDFKDVALNALSSRQNTKKATPAPVRSGGGKSTKGGLDFTNMSDADFDKFNEQIRKGAVFRPNR